MRDILGDFQTLCLRSLWFEHWLLWVFFDPSNRVEREPMRLSGLPDWAQSCRSNCVGGEVFAIPEVSEHRPTSICYVDVYKVILITIALHKLSQTEYTI